MDPQLLLPSPAADFNFDSTSTSPYATAPSSPKILFPKFFYATPTNAADDLQEAEAEADHMDFAFDFSGQLEPPSISDADELFDGGKIKPLEPPPPPPPVSYHRKMNLEPCTEALRRTPNDQTQNPSSRGRERTATTTGHKTSRSLSPLRASDEISSDQKVSTTQPSSSSASLSSQFGFTWYNKWNLKNLLLFRSTSEGSATTIGDQSKKYAVITKGDGDVKNLSFRSCDGGGSVGSSRRMKRKMSAHEIHYTANRAVAEEMRRRTLLPYKSGLLGCLGFSRNLHEVSSRGRR